MKLTLIIISVLALSSCSMPMSINSFEKELRQISGRTSSLTKKKWRKEVFYQGYNEKYHFFYINTGLGFPKKVKVLKDELDLTHKYPFTNDRSAWLPYSEVK